MSTTCSEEESDLRRGPWTFEEDSKLTHYITTHGEGRWNMVAKCSGLKRTGKSCRLRWLNYLKPDIKRGNLTPQEQILILELHSKWGNRWSKIAAHLPGRTDNEIKNYWRTRVQKQARQLKIDSNSNNFFEALKRFWMPRLIEKMEQNASVSSEIGPPLLTNSVPEELLSHIASSSNEGRCSNQFVSEKSSSTILEESEYTTPQVNECYHVDISSFGFEDFGQLDVPVKGSEEINVSNCQMAEFDWMNCDVEGGTIWNMDELWEF